MYRLSFKTILFSVIILLCSWALLIGQTWTLQTSNTSNILEAVFFIDDQIGWTVGNSGTSLFTTNGGETWSLFNLTNDDLKDVSFFDASIGLIVGDNGRIFRTSNGGNNWSQVNSGTTSNILAVCFGEGGMAYAAGRDGLILTSTDYGASWSIKETGTVRYRGAAAFGNQNAWVVAEEGKIKTNSNAGSNWTDQTSGVTSDLHDVFFISALEGWIAGQNDALLYTANGGSSWSSRNSGINVGLESVFFLDSNLGWAVGANGSIFKTINGGNNWIIQASGVQYELNDVFFHNENIGWSVGENGTILNYKAATSIDHDNSLIAIPQSYILEQNFPNPFNPETNIRFGLSEPRHVRLEIFSAYGQSIRLLVDAEYSAGFHTTKWDGADDDGEKVATGFYLCRIQAGNYGQVIRMFLIK